MTSYLEITAVQNPFPFDVDGNERVIFSCNYDAQANAPVDNWPAELARLLATAGLVASVDDVLIGPLVQIPKDDDGPFVQVIDTGGIPPLETHNITKTQRLSAQVLVRAKVYDVARTLADAIWSELDGKRNFTVTA